MEKAKKTDNFLNAIKKYADEQRSAMHEEVRQLKEEKIKEAEKKAKYDGEKLIKDKLEEKRNQVTSKIAKMMQEGQRELFLERAAMTDEVFKKAEERLIEYTKTSEYSEMLTDSAKQMAALFGDEACVLYINERDSARAEALKTLFKGELEVVEDKKIKIGGLKGYCSAKRIVADDTLDSRLDGQREWFIENSGLKVT